MSDLISRLRGDGYLLLNIHERQTLDYEAAYELDRLNAQALDLCAEISGLRRENESMRHDLGVLRGHHHEGCMAEIERLREENNVLSAREARAENSALHLGALVDELRGLLRDINSRPRHLNAGAWEIRLYQDDYDRIDAALAGAAVQPDECPACGRSTKRHPGYVLGNHWLESAYERICAGEAEDDVLRDYDVVRVTNPPRAVKP